MHITDHTILNSLPLADKVIWRILLVHFYVNIFIKMQLKSQILKSFLKEDLPPKSRFITAGMQRHLTYHHKGITTGCERLRFDYFKVQIIFPLIFKDLGSDCCCTSSNDPSFTLLSQVDDENVTCNTGKSWFNARRHCNASVQFLIQFCVLVISI